MLNFGNKEFRNLQEQVLKNAQDIETLKGREDLQIVIVNELPAVGNPNYIYLVAKNDGESPDVYDEYIWLENEQRYEKIGGVTIDLSNYITTDTEQTITGEKTFQNRINLPPYINLPQSGATISCDASNEIGISKNEIRFDGNVRPWSENAFDLGTSSYNWKDLHLSGVADFNGASIGMDANLLKIKRSNNTALGISENAIYANFAMVTSNVYPQITNSYNLGDNTHYWNNFYLAGNISDGANTVTVANIASKATSTFISGSFDSNGESTIDTEQAGTPEGLFIFTYGNCQCFLRLTATMVQNADLTPIRVSCPMIFNNDAVFGWLEISRSGATLTIRIINDAHDHVDSGYAWTLTKTNLL